MNPYFKPVGCTIRRTPPIGPLKICADYCKELLNCIKATKFQKETGTLPTKWKRKKGFIDFEPRSRFCSKCHKPIARASTRLGSFKGMFVQHIKHKHPEIYKKYKAGKIEYQELFYIKDLKKH